MANQDGPIIEAKYKHQDLMVLKRMMSGQIDDLLNAAVDDAVKNQEEIEDMLGYLAHHIYVAMGKSSLVRKYRQGE